MVQPLVQTGHCVLSHLCAIGMIEFTLPMNSNSIAPDELLHSPRRAVEGEMFRLFLYTRGHMGKTVSRVTSQEHRFVPFIKFVLISMVIGIVSQTSVAQKATAHPAWPGPGQLFVGTCYQPIDRSVEQIDQDISIMRHAGFNVVRMGDLSWDSFEPSQGKFDFEWFDRIMDKMQANGIRVIVDIPGTPAPIWLHRKYPGIDIVE